MADQKALVTLKDGTKIIVDDLSQLSKYSDRQDLDSISFFGDDEMAARIKQEEKFQQEEMVAPPPAALINASLTIDTDPKQEAKTVATVGQPTLDPVVPKPQPAGDGATTITVTIGALAGAASSAGMPALTNLAKNFIKGKLKFKGKKTGDSKPEEEKDEPTDCKTHQLKSSAKFASISARITALENKNQQESKLFNSDSNPLEDLEERIEKLEKQLKAKGKKK
jgi:HPt (histidine-containing phosphotransfer) domain-containing protein